MVNASSYLGKIQDIKADLEMDIIKSITSIKDWNFTVTLKGKELRPVVKNIDGRRGLVFTDGTSGISAAKMPVELLADAYDQIEQQVR